MSPLEKGELMNRLQAAAARLSGAELIKLVERLEGPTLDRILTVGGVSFRCQECGSNVFRAIERDVYRCNGCGACYTSNDGLPRELDGAVEYATIPRMAAGEARRHCYKCNCWLVPNAPGPVVQLRDGRWRCGTIFVVKCRRLKQEPARDVVTG